MNRQTFLTALAVLFIAAISPALAKGFDQALSILRPTDTTTVTDKAESGDFTYRYDVDTLNVTKVDANAPEAVVLDAVQLSDNTVTLDSDTYAERIVYVSASGGNQTITLPDGGTKTDDKYILRVGDQAPAGDYTVTIQVASGDNSYFAGSVLAYDEGGTTFYHSASTLSGTDTITLSSANTEVGDEIVLTSIATSVWDLTGDIRFESLGQETVLFSSSVTSTD